MSKALSILRNFDHGRILFHKDHNESLQILYTSVILFGQIYLLLQEAFQIQKSPYYSQFCVIFPKYNEKSLVFSQMQRYR